MKSTFFVHYYVKNLWKLKATGKMSPGTETFISPSYSYAHGYDGIKVQFTVRNRTVNWLTKIGVRDASTLTSSLYPNMQPVFKGWMSTNAYFKAEGTIVNIGLGYGKALNIFNKGILSFFAL